MHSLEFVPIYFAEHDAMLQRLSKDLEHVFACGVRVRRPWFDPEVTFDTSRGQYRSTAMLRHLLNGPVEPSARILGVTSVDLFTPILTYVFGEAQLEGRAALVSLHRLRPELYGLPTDEALLYERLKKESVHELGHTYGLLHCDDPECVMHASTYAEQIDFKHAAFCDTCLDTVRAASPRAASRPAR